MSQGGDNHLQSSECVLHLTNKSIGIRGVGEGPLRIVVGSRDNLPFKCNEQKEKHSKKIEPKHGTQPTLERTCDERFELCTSFGKNLRVNSGPVH